ncbi:MAG: PAS domain S-box protein [Lentisphaerota bacterium]
MNDASFLSLIQNVALLFAAISISGLSMGRWGMRPALLRQVSVGLVLGVIGIVIMLTPWKLAPGIVFDTRSVLIGLSGLFFGALPTAMVMMMTASFRLYQGGVGAWTGVGVILSSGVIGIVWRAHRKRPLAGIRWGELYSFGLVIHAAMLLLMLTLPWDVATQVLLRITLPVLLIYPLGTSLLGALLANRFFREQVEQDLRKSEERLEMALAGAGEGIIDWDFDAHRITTSALFAEMLGYRTEEFPQTSREFTALMHPDDRKACDGKFQDLLAGRMAVLDVEVRFQTKQGGWKWISARGRIVQHDATGRAVRYLGTHVDIHDRKQTEEALRESESKFRALAENSRDFIMRYDRNHRHIYANPAAIQVAGRTVEEYIGKTHREMGLSADLCGTWETAIDRVFTTGLPHKEIFEWVGANGPAVLDWRLYPERGSDGKVSSVLGVSRDITEQKKSENQVQELLNESNRTQAALLGILEDQKQAEEKLRQSEHQYRQLFESSADALFLIATDTGRLLEVNNMAPAIYGYAREELLTMKSWDVSAEPEETRRLTQGQRTEPNKVFLIPSRLHRKKDGTVFPVDITARSYVRDGKTVLLVASRDITERKKAEESLRESEERFRQIFNNMADGVALYQAVDEGRDFVFVNINKAGESSSHVRKEEIVGKRVSEVFPSVSKIGLLDVFRHVWETGVAEHHPTSLYKDDRIQQWVENYVCKLSSGLIATIYADVTVRKQAEEELKRRNDEMVRFTYTVSHDLKSPLVTIKTFMGYLEKDLQARDVKAQAEDIGYIKNAADKMGNLLTELLELSRIGRKTNPLMEVPLQSVIQAGLNLVAGRISTTGVKVVVTELPVMLYGDVPRLEELYQNLIDNSVKFMGDQPDPRIELGAQQEGAKIILFVRDNGGGIDPRCQKRLFGLFEKLDKNTEGIGMGLAIVKRIIEVHGGEIRVESEGLGKGTTFWFTLGGIRLKEEEAEGRIGTLPSA